MNHFQAMDEIVQTFFSHPAFKTKGIIAYCDYIAALISANLKASDNEDKRLLSSVSKPKYDLTEDGSFKSTKKTIEIEDRFGKQYRITVEEI
jgi:hypothetical protein